MYKPRPHQKKENLLLLILWSEDSTARQRPELRSYGRATGETTGRHRLTAASHRIRRLRPVAVFILPKQGTLQGILPWGAAIQRPCLVL